MRVLSYRPYKFFKVNLHITFDFHKEIMIGDPNEMDIGQSRIHCDIVLLPLLLSYRRLSAVPPCDSKWSRRTWNWYHDLGASSMGQKGMPACCLHCTTVSLRKGPTSCQNMLLIII